MLPELLVLIFDYLPLSDLIQLYYVNNNLRHQVAKHFDRCYLPSDIALEVLIKSGDIEGWDDNYPRRHSGWAQLSFKCHLSPRIIERFSEKLEWKWLKYNSSWTLEFIDKYLDRWNWEKMSENIILTEEIIQRYYHKWKWERLSRNPSLTPQMIIDYEQEWDRCFAEYTDQKWYGISRNPSLTLPLLQKYEEKWFWPAIAEEIKITTEIIDAYLTKWDWHNQSTNKTSWAFLSRNKHLTAEIILRYLPKWDWPELCVNTCLTAEIVKQCSVPGSHWSVTDLLRNPSLSWDSLAPLDDDEWPYYEIQVRGRIHASRHLKISTGIIRRHISIWNWDVLSENFSLTAAIVDGYPWYKGFKCNRNYHSGSWGGCYPIGWNWTILNRNSCFTKEIIARYKEVWDGPVTEETRVIKKYHKKWDWRVITCKLMKRDWRVFLDHPEFPWTLNPKKERGCWPTSK